MSSLAKSNKNSAKNLKIKVAQISVSKIENSCEQVSQLLRALSHPQRLMILGHLIKGRKTVSELQELCVISQSQLSQFLIRMKNEDLLSCEREGKYQFYSIADQRVIQLISALQDLFCR